MGVKNRKGCSLTFSSILIFELLWFCYPIIMRTSFLRKMFNFYRKKIYIFILMSIIEKNMRVLFGKINDKSLKKHKKHKTFKSIRKLIFLWKERRFFESAPPPRFTILIKVNPWSALFSNTKTWNPWSARFDKYENLKPVILSFPNIKNWNP